MNGSRIFRLVASELPPGISFGVATSPDSTDRIHTLTIGGRERHNETTIQCVAIAELNGTSVDTSIVTFLIQGQFL